MSTEVAETPAEEVAAPAPEPRRRLSLRDAVRVCGMSEKTLRRKLEAGVLQGHREALDYGGFMWLIEARSLAELYPSPALDEFIASGGDSEVEPEEPGEAPPPSPAPLANLTDVEPDKDFLAYLMEQTRQLRDEVRSRDERLQELQSRALVLEREVGEQRGTAVTQARVLEWFQKQPTPALPPPPAPAAAPLDTPAKPAVRPVLWAVLGTLAVTGLLLTLVGHLAGRL